MTLTQEAITALVEAKRANGMTTKEIEEYFKDSFKSEMIDIELYTMAIAETYQSRSEEPTTQEKIDE